MSLPFLQQAVSLLHIYFIVISSFIILQHIFENIIFHYTYYGFHRFYLLYYNIATAAILWLLLQRHFLISSFLPHMREEKPSSLFHLLHTLFHVYSGCVMQVYRTHYICYHISCFSLFLLITTVVVFHINIFIHVTYYIIRMTYTAARRAA